MTHGSPSLGSHPLRPLTDLGNAERLLDDHGGEIRYVTAWKTWVIWDTTRWKRDDKQEIEKRAQQTVRNIVRDIVLLMDAQAALPADERLPDEHIKSWQDAIYKHQRASESAARIRAMIECAEAQAAITPQQLDANQWAFNVRNGVVDLRTGELLPHEPTQLLTKRSDVEFRPDAECPIWHRFLDRIFDGELDLIGYLQRAVGYTLTGVTSEQILHLCHGTGFNGKSKFLGAMGDLMGDYAISADFTSFLENKRGGPREDLARLAGSRLVRSIEVGEGRRLNEPLIKGLTGEDTIAARFLYSGTFEFQPEFKLWLGVNHKPVIRGTDFAIWRRIRLIPFLVTIPLDDRDPNLSEKLKGELSGILNWAIEGCLAWQRHGLKPPAIVQMVSDQYRAESDILGAFLEECCEFDQSFAATSRELYGAYKRWCDDNGEHCVTQTQFGRKLDERGHDVSRVRAGKQRHGLRLRPDHAHTNGDRPWF